MSTPSRSKIGGFLAFALAVTASTATPEAHADMFKDFADSLKRQARLTTAQSVSQSIDRATPGVARRAAIGLPSQTGTERPTVADKVVGRVMRDASSYTYSSIGSTRSALSVPGMPNSGSLPGYGGSFGGKVKDSVTDVAKDTAGDTIKNVTTGAIDKMFSIFDRDDSPSR